MLPSSDAVVDGLVLESPLGSNSRTTLSPLSKDLGVAHFPGGMDGGCERGERRGGKKFAWQAGGRAKGERRRRRRRNSQGCCRLRPFLLSPSPPPHL